jgi:SAM-dependent methyltransferase
MYNSFPIGLIPLLRCAHDAGSVRIQGVNSGKDNRFTNGCLECESCGRTYSVVDGIVKMLDEMTLVGESAYERRSRDELAESWLHEEPSDYDKYAIDTKMSLLSPFGGVCLEMGCGSGRLTILIADKFASTLAMDFSEASLRLLAHRLDAHANVGLVQADVTKLAVSPGQFDRCLSTLVSNLPSTEHRAAMFRLATTALRPNGRFVYATHHQSLRSRWKKVPQDGHYPGSGVYRYHFFRSEVLEEARPFFDSVKVFKRSLYLPFPFGRLGRMSRALEWVAERLPVTDQLAELLVVSAEKPIP